MILICCPGVPYEVEMRERNKRPALNSSIRFHVFMRDEGRCTHTDSRGARCEQRKFLEIHQIVEVAHGGSDAPENLALFCSDHHQARHPHFKISSQLRDRKEGRFGRWIRDASAEYLG